MAGRFQPIPGASAPLMDLLTKMNLSKDHVDLLYIYPFTISYIQIVTPSCRSRKCFGWVSRLTVNPAQRLDLNGVAQHPWLR